VVAINRNAWSQSIGTTGRNHPVRAQSWHPADGEMCHHLKHRRRQSLGRES
jgi:hypothetical protein